MTLEFPMYSNINLTETTSSHSTATFKIFTSRFDWFKVATCETKLRSLAVHWSFPEIIEACNGVFFLSNLVGESHKIHSRTDDAMTSHVLTYFSFRTICVGAAVMICRESVTSQLSSLSSRVGCLTSSAHIFD